MKNLHALSDAELRRALKKAENRELNARNDVSECRLHLLMRSHVEKEHLKDQIQALQSKLDNMRSGSIGL